MRKSQADHVEFLSAATNFFAPLANWAGNWNEFFRAKGAAGEHDRIMSNLDSRIRYDIGADDRRPLPAKPAHNFCQGSVEAMLNRSI